MMTYAMQSVTRDAKQLEVLLTMLALQNGTATQKRLTVSYGIKHVLTLNTRTQS